MNKEELTEKAQELTIKNVTNGKSKYYSWGFHNGCVVGLEYNNNRIVDLEKENAELKKALKNDKVCKCIHYLNFKDLEAELTKAKELLQFVSEYEDMTCYADELEEIKQFLEK